MRKVSRSEGGSTMRFQTYRRVKRGAVTALVLVPVAAVGALLLPANAQDGKIGGARQRETGRVAERVDDSASPPCRTAPCGTQARRAATCRRAITGPS